MQSDDGNKDKMQQFAVFVTIPFILAVPPLVGWAIGSWLDRKFDTSPYIMMVGIFMGLAGGFIDFYRLIKKFGSE